jgi:hypothetical protein
MATTMASMVARTVKKRNRILLDQGMMTVKLNRLDRSGPSSK